MEVKFSFGNKNKKKNKIKSYTKTKKGEIDYTPALENKYGMINRSGAPISIDEFIQDIPNKPDTPESKWGYDDYTGGNNATGGSGWNT